MKKTMEKDQMPEVKRGKIMINPLNEEYIRNSFASYNWWVTNLVKV
jgi:hypothetical protein